MCDFKDREAFIEKYLRKELSESEQYLFEKHFTGCDECFGEIEAAQQMMELIREEGEVLFPEHTIGTASSKDTQHGILFHLNKIFTPKWKLRPSLAYTFIAVILIIAGLYLLTPSLDDNGFTGNEQITGSDDEVTPQIEKNEQDPDQPDSEKTQVEMYAANFVESEDLEYLIDQQMRSGGNITVVSPDIGYNVTEKVLFKWVTDSDGQVRLKILNNAEDNLFEFALNENKLSFNVFENELEPGLYYWKLEKDNQLLHLGKFVYNGK